MEFFISTLQSYSSEVLLLFEFISLFLLVTSASYFFGKDGLYTMIILTMVVANLQVLKLANFGFYPEPIALGKMAICFSFLTTDVITECFGKRAAYKGVFLGFFANTCLMLLMVITVGYPPITQHSGLNMHQELQQIFTPVPFIFLAGVFAFFVSQFLDINLYAKIKEISAGKYLWLRSFVSTTTASLIDNVIFYTLALYIFQSLVPFDTLLYTYILGTFVFRLCITFFSSFIIYVIKCALNAGDGQTTNRLWQTHSIN